MLTETGLVVMGFPVIDDEEQLVLLLKAHQRYKAIKTELEGQVNSIGVSLN